MLTAKSARATLLASAPVKLAGSQPALSPSDLVRIEADALAQLARRLETSMHLTFETAVSAIVSAVEQHAKIILTGVGKSGLVAQKIAATLRSTGTPAHFLHPTEALHGDLGMMAEGDLVLAFSGSGETPEILGLLPIFNRLKLQVIAFCGASTSTLARGAKHLLDISVDCEACPHNLAPTASTTVMLALGDALALSVSQHRGFAPEDFADLHPGGQLGRRLRYVRDLMHTGDAIPRVLPEARLPEILHEMSRKKLGLAAVTQADGRLLGIISDGDLRRLLEREGAQALERLAADVMNRTPQTIAEDTFASAALAVLEERKITALLVTGPAGELRGVLHLHDLWALHLI